VRAIVVRRMWANAAYALWYPGAYSDYEADRKARLGPAAERPHRIQYRQLTRA